jgi:hypothetical protein
MRIERGRVKGKNHRGHVKGKEGFETPRRRDCLALSRR